MTCQATEAVRQLVFATPTDFRADSADADLGTDRQQAGRDRYITPGSSGSCSSSSCGGSYSSSARTPRSQDLGPRSIVPAKISR